MRIGRHFAIAYRWFEYGAFGHTLERSRLQYLHRLAGARRILVLGCGDGRMLPVLLRVAPFASIDVLELSTAMIALAKVNAASERVHFDRADALNTSWEHHGYDAVITDFFLDCFQPEDASNLIQKVAEALVPCGLWIVTEFNIPETGWRRVHAQIWIASMYRFFALATGLTARRLPPFERLLKEAGLRKLAFVERRAGLIRSEIWRNCDRS